MCVLIPTYALHTEGFCVLLPLLPGDFPGFGLGKPEWTNQQFVVPLANQSALRVHYLGGNTPTAMALHCF